MKTSTIAAVLVVLFAVLGGWYASGLPPMQQLKSTYLQGPVACTAEAMQCPDGSYVGRSGPNCEFVCPVATTTTTVPPGGGTGGSTGGGQGFAQYHSGIRGIIMAGPTCPVERDPPDPKCADKPVKTNVSVYRASDTEHAIAMLASSEQGTFEVSLPPGDYIVMSGPYGVPYPRCGNETAAVGPNAYAIVKVECDTGIR